MKHEMLVDVRDVEKRFRYGVFFGFTFKALDGVSLYIENKPVIYTVAGESGSGKTTLARVILGMLKPERGYVLYKGRDIYRLSREEIRWFRKEV
jgi:peptide/nickel transport system ATP-binding protein